MANLRNAFASTEFRWLWAAEALSVLGDQVARVALAVLVYSRTGSAAATGATYAATLLPSLLGGFLLSGLADRYPRRCVMIVTDLARAALIGGMAWPGLPWPAMLVLLVLAQLGQAPFAGAQSATLPFALPGDLLTAGQALRTVTFQALNLGGFAVGGVLIALVGAEAGLLLDALSFVASAALIRIGVPARPAPDHDDEQESSEVSDRIRSGFGLIWSDKTLRTLLAFGLLAGASIVPEGLIAPLVSENGLGASPTWVGIAMAAEPAGAVIGGLLLAEVASVRQLRLLGPLAIGTSIPLILFFFRPSIPACIGFLIVSGVCSSYQLTTGSTLIRLVPNGRLGRAFGIARSMLVAAQGGGVAIGGLLAQEFGASMTIFLAGVIGTILAAATTRAWTRVGPDKVAAALSS